jgi:hypothetical protein
VASRPLLLNLPLFERQLEDGAIFEVWPNENKVGKKKKWLEVHAEQVRLNFVARL